MRSWILKLCHLPHVTRYVELAPLGLSLTPLTLSSVHFSCASSPSPRVKIIRAMVKMGNRHQAKKEYKLFRARVGNKREGKEKKKEEKEARIWVGETKRESSCQDKMIYCLRAHPTLKKNFF